MARFFADEIRGDIAFFYEDAQHMARILRLQPGDEITALDGQGQEAKAVILTVERDKVQAKLSGWQLADGEPGIRVTVYQGLCKGDRFETVVQKCTELGATDIVPLYLAHCEVKIEDMDKRLPRLRKIAREASKQSSRGRVPAIHTAISLERAGIDEHDLLLCPYEAAKEHGLRTVLEANRGARNIGIIIGPEGGLAENEVAFCLKNSARVVTLGPRILRTETAAPAVISVVMTMLGQWDGTID